MLIPLDKFGHTIHLPTYLHNKPSFTAVIQFSLGRKGQATTQTPNDTRYNVQPSPVYTRPGRNMQQPVCGTDLIIVFLYKTRRMQSVRRSVRTEGTNQARITQILKTKFYQNPITINRRVAHLRTVKDAGPSSLQEERRNGIICTLGSTVFYYQSQFNTMPFGLPKMLTLCNTYWPYVFRPRTSPAVTFGTMCFGPQGHL